MLYDEMVERYKNDPVSFVLDFGVIRTPSSKDNNVPFDFDGKYENTEDLLDLFRRSNHTVIGKKRQQGISWRLIAFAAWHMIVHPDAHVLFASPTSNMSRPQKSRMEFFLKNLSNHVELDLKHPTDDSAFFELDPNIKLFNGSVIEFKSMIAEGLSHNPLFIADEVQVFGEANADAARAISQSVSRSILVGTRFDAENHERELTWFDAYVDHVQFTDGIRVIRL